MKKRLVIPAALVFSALCFSSCDSKLCYCYENGEEQQLYISPDLPCNSQGTATRGCVEQNERMNPDDVAWK